MSFGEKQLKYPRTPHLRDLSTSDLIGHKLVLEEKMDGSQAGIRFGPGRELILFSRGHSLDGGHIGESQFDLFKQWANTKRYELWQLLGENYVMYGEWLQCLHSVYYDLLPHYFLEYDIYCPKENEWFSTEMRQILLQDSGIHSVKVVKTVDVNKQNIDSLYVNTPTPSLFKSPSWRESMIEAAKAAGYDQNDIPKLFDSVDNTSFMEGFYIKIENGTNTLGRAKQVRSDFIDTAAASVHWTKRLMIQNKLREGDSIWS